MEKLIIYKASAGSGKTYKLTEEYLGMALRSPFGQILAVTFTNKATAEMKERITGVLNGLASGDDSSYLKVLMEVTGMDEDSLRKKSHEVLEDILHNYSRFSVGTIDSFFQRVIRGFARESGLQSAFELELDNSRVLDKVIDRILEETETNAELRKWLMRYADSRIRDGQSWSFRKDIGRLGEQVFSETFMQFRQEMTRKLSDKAFMNDYLSSLYALKSKFENEMSGLGLTAVGFMGERGLTVRDFSYGATGVAGYFEKIAAKKNFEPGKRVLDALDNPDAWSSKSSKRRDEIAAAVEDGLNTFLKDAIEKYSAAYPEYVTANMVIANFYTLGILNDITRQTREYAEENNLFLLSDVASLLAGIINGNEAPFIYEKTGHFYRHFMIDEFQDTSRIQWNNFIPLITDSLSENKRNILVGDIKQSIYRWRNGDWRILAGEVEQEMKLFEPVVRPLEINWRSRRNLVEFNNMLFERSPAIMQEQFRREYADSALPGDAGAVQEEQIATAYRDHSQRVPDDPSKEGGYVSVRFAGDGHGNWKEEVLDELPGLLAGIINKGYNRRDIAILVRNSRDGRDIAKRLLEWQAATGRDTGMNLDFISEEFLLLRESVSVRLLAALIRFLSDPSDKINIAEMLNLWCRYVNRPKDDNFTVHGIFGGITADDNRYPEELLPDEFASERDHLQQLSLYELTERLISIFGLNNLPGEAPYLMAFQDVVLDYSGKEGGGPGSFAGWWEENGGRFSVSSSDSQDAMRIMTIHKSKGLQFKVVVLPFGEWKTDHNPLHDNFMWCRPDRPPFNRLDLVPVKYKSDLAGSIFVVDYFNEKMQVFVDNLNLLYVAFTRAEEELHVFTPTPAENRKEKDQVKSVSELLYRILPVLPATGEMSAVSYPDVLTCSWSEEKRWFTAGTTGSPSGTPGKEYTGEFRSGAYRVNDFRTKLKLRLYGNLYLDKEGETGKNIARGRLMHEIFENIVTAADVKRAVKQKCYEGLVSSGEIDALADQIHSMIDDRRVAGWFDGSWKVRNETGILLKTGRTRRPDRVMIREGEVVVVDYKFGASGNPGYAGQVRRYMKEIENMGYANVKGFVWYPSAGELDEVEL